MNLGNILCMNRFSYYLRVGVHLVYDVAKYEWTHRSCENIVTAICCKETQYSYDFYCIFLDNVAYKSVLLKNPNL